MTKYERTREILFWLVPITAAAVLLALQVSR